MPWLLLLGHTDAMAYGAGAIVLLPSLFGMWAAASLCLLGAGALATLHRWDPEPRPAAMGVAVLGAAFPWLMVLALSLTFGWWAGVRSGDTLALWFAVIMSFVFSVLLGLVVLWGLYARVEPREGPNALTFLAAVLRTAAALVLSLPIILGFWALSWSNTGVGLAQSLGLTPLATLLAGNLGVLFLLRGTHDSQSATVGYGLVVLAELVGVCCLLAPPLLMLILGG